MIVQEDVPFSVDQLTADWLSHSLKDSGLLQDGQVEALVVQPIGDQVGFNGEVVLVVPTYANLSASESKSVPKSMILKIPTASKNRILGQTMGLYEKEIRFYRDLRSQLNIRTPKHYCSALDIADDPEVVLERLRGMNRLPIWVISGIMVLANWMSSGNPRRYALFIEDLSGYRMGDQAAGCTDADIQNIVSTMGLLHAQFWGSKALAEMKWIAPYSVTSRIMQMRYLKSIGRYLAEESKTLTSQQRDMLGWLRRNGVNLTERYGDDPATLLHGDFRLDNICFDDKTNEVVLFDWQTLQAGPGTSDLAYFISATLPESAGEENVNELLALYHRVLTEQGVALELAQVRWQYEVGMLLMLHRVLPTIYDGNMDLSVDRGLPLLKAWLARILSRLKSVDHSKLLD